MNEAKNHDRYEVARRRMVTEQLVSGGIKDRRVLDAMGKVPRHEFVNSGMMDLAYEDRPLQIGMGQTISQPFMVAIMTEALALTGPEKILEIGTGSGYQAAILAELAKEVYSIERIDALSIRARRALHKLLYQNIHFRIGDGTLGWPEEAPFDRIIITAANPHIPLPLTEQLNESGRLILPLGEDFTQILTLVEKKGNRLESSSICGCVFVPLVGKYGHPK